MIRISTTVRHILFCAILAYQVETLAALLCKELFTTTNSEAQFLHSKDPQLHMSPWVEKVVARLKKTTGISLSQPSDKLASWLDDLARIARKADSSPRVLEQMSSIIYDQYVMKLNEVPESYYAMQVRLARERGHGDISLSAEQKIQLAENVIEDQRKTLQHWINYLVSKDTSMYPIWLKYWMFTGMTKLSKYNTTAGTFNNRDKGTVAPFPELNREALSLTVDLVLKKMQKKSLEDVSDPTLVKLLEGMNLGKIYGRILFNLGVGNDGQFKTNQGRWVVYPKGSDHLPLVESLAGKNTGWCTAGEATAITQLSAGDFHVYYSLDKKGEPTIPRVAIRMQDYEIAEVRGVAHDQNLDSQISQSPVVTQKLKEFGRTGLQYEKKDHDVKLLTSIEAKDILNQPLTKEELKFLYELDYEIEGFGNSIDPRIEQIKLRRNKKNDFVVIYDHKYKSEEISLTMDDVLTGKIKIHLGHLKLTAEQITQLQTLPEIVTGNFTIMNLTSAKGIKLPELVGGEFRMMGLVSADGLILPTLHGSCHLPDLQSAQGLVLPETMNGNLHLSSLKSAEGLRLPRYINGGLFMKKLISAVGIKLSEVITGNLDLSGLISSEGLQLPPTFRGKLYLWNMPTHEQQQLQAKIKND
ncbi:MAG: hypothetical protein WA160_14790 [Pseudobdellovibrio sp.]